MLYSDVWMLCFDNQSQIKFAYVIVVGIGLVDLCDPTPCLNGGICEGTGSRAYTCQCINGWNGTHCDQGYYIINA